MMDVVAAVRREGRARRWWVLLTAVLLLVAVGGFTVGFSGQNAPVGSPASPPATQAATGEASVTSSPVASSGPESTTVPPSPGPPSSAVVAAPPPSAIAVPAPPPAAIDRDPRPGFAPRSGPALARSAPVRLRIPAIGLSVPLSSLGLNPDRTVEVPTDFQQAGWYRLGPSPGQVGSAVILGHVDSFRGPAAFFRLRSLRPGDEVEVELADGVTVRFAVREVASYLKTQFPSRQVYASQGYSALQLVTCGGEFDRRTRSYLSNVVVYTSLVASSTWGAGDSK